MNKKKIFFGFSILIFIIMFFRVASATCSIGSNPLDLELNEIAGKTISASWNFYNLYGNRTTDVNLEVIEKPSGWNVRFEPKSFSLDLLPIVEAIPENIPQGIDYLKHPSKDGYIPVKVVKIYIDIPKDAENKEYSLIFEAIGNCFLEGAVIPAISTQLNLDVILTSENYDNNKIGREDKKSDGIIDVFGNVIRTIQLKDNINKYTISENFLNENKETQFNVVQDVVEESSIQKLVFGFLVTIIVLLIIIKFILK